MGTSDSEIYGHDSRQLWYGLNGEPITTREANELLGDSNRRRIGHASITTDRGRVTVSTVHLVLNHSFMGGPPVLWETMTFGGPLDDEQNRYTSAEAARTGHEEAVTHALMAIDLAGAKVIAIEHAQVDSCPTITCPRCGRTSAHPKDISERYCGNCHMFHADME